MSRLFCPTALWLWCCLVTKGFEEMDEKSGYPGQQPPPPQYPPASGGGSIYPGLPSAPPSYQQSQTVAGQGTFQPLNVQTYFTL